MKYEGGFSDVLIKPSLNSIRHTPLPKSNENKKTYDVIKIGRRRQFINKRYELVQNTMRQYSYLHKIVKGAYKSKEFRQSIPMKLVSSVASRYTENRSIGKRFNDDTVMHFYSMM